MIKAVFTEKKGMYIGFRISGHAGFADSGHDIVCASVSSAVMFAVNLITEAFEIGADVEVSENFIELIFDKKFKHETHTVNDILLTLESHLDAISEEFPKTIAISTIKISEV